MRLKDKRAFITGAGSGVGWETARQMVSEGAQAALISLPSDDVERKAKRLAAPPLSASPRMSPTRRR